MMNKQSSRFTVPNWFKWTMAVLLLVLIVVLGLSSFLYNEVLQSKTEGYEESKEKAIAETKIEQVTEVNRYSGDNLYHVVSGVTEGGEKAFVFVPVNEDNDDKDIQFFDKDNILSKDDMVLQWQNSCDNCELIQVNLALEKEQPLWEFKYIDDKARYVFEYFSAENVDSYEQFRLQRSLN